MCSANKFVIVVILFMVSAVVLPDKSMQDKFDRPIIGADISWVQQQEEQGRKFSDDGVEKDVLKILVDNKFNWVRLRLFVDSKAEKGYSKEGYCDLEHTLVMAKRIKAAGLKLLLDFHYSDNWADPGKQSIPVSWEGLELAELEEKVYKYTNDIIKRFAAEGVKPDMVQTGNEIHHGFLWSQGKIGTDGDAFCGLLKRAVAGVRDADPGIKIMLHIAQGGQSKGSIAFFDMINQHGIKFDIIGQSYYPKYHGTLKELEQNLSDLAKRYKKPIVVVEYQHYRKEVNDIVRKLPDELGLGTFIWEATSPQWGNLFDEDGSTNTNMDIYPALYEDYKD